MSENSRFQRSRLAVAVGAALSLGSAQVYAAEGAGRVLSTRGSVFAVTEDGSTRALSQGGHVYSGDIIETREGRVQIRFHDGGLVSLKPGTEFAIEEYTTDADGDGGNAAMRLLKGAMRTITGAIDGEGDDEYSVETPVATIGIRGTQYALTLCDTGRCGDDVDEGLYGQVVSNRITVRNEAGQGSFSSGSWFQVPDGNTRPKRILQPAGVIFRGDAAAETGEASGDGDDPDSNDSGPRYDPGAREAARLGGDGQFAPEFSEMDRTGLTAAAEGFNTEVLPNALAAATAIGTGASSYYFGPCLSDTQCAAGVDADGNLRRLEEFGSGRVLDATRDVSLVESGQLPSLDTRWGRWEGDIVVDGLPETEVVGGSMPWAYSTNPTTAAQLQTKFSGGGSLSFNMAGGPSPVGDIHGEQWSVTNLSVSMGFSGGNADIAPGSASLGLEGPSATISVDNGAGATNDTAAIDANAGERGFSLNLGDSLGPDNATISAIFAGDNGEGLILDFKATDASSGETITGVKILEENLN